MRKIVLDVERMECQGCANRINNVVKNIDCVKNVVANFETGIVEIEAEDNVNEDLIKEKICDLGFKVK